MQNSGASFHSTPKLDRKFTKFKPIQPVEQFPQLVFFLKKTVSASQLRKTSLAGFPATSSARTGSARRGRLQIPGLKAGGGKKNKHLVKTGYDSLKLKIIFYGQNWMIWMNLMGYFWGFMVNSWWNYHIDQTIRINMELIHDLLWDARIDRILGAITFHIDLIISLGDTPKTHPYQMPIDASKSIINTPLVQLPDKNKRLINQMAKTKIGSLPMANTKAFWSPHWQVWSLGALDWQKWWCVVCPRDSHHPIYGFVRARWAGSSRPG